MMLCTPVTTQRGSKADVNDLYLQGAVPLRGSQKHQLEPAAVFMLHSAEELDCGCG